MSKITSKLQVTIPKALAERYGLAPGDEIEFVPAGETIRVVPAATTIRTPNVARRLELFDQATRRQRAREHGTTARRPTERGWTREELHTRGGADRH